MSKAANGRSRFPLRKPARRGAKSIVEHGLVVVKYRKINAIRSNSHAVKTMKKKLFFSMIVGVYLLWYNQVKSERMIKRLTFIGIYLQ